MSAGDEEAAAWDSAVPTSGDQDDLSDKALQRTYKPVADTYLDSRRSTSNYGTVTELIVDAAPDVQRALIRFTVPTMSEVNQGAKLRLFVTNGSVNGPRMVVTSNSWTETSVTWSTRPSSSGTEVANLARVSSGWIEMDVSAAVKSPGTYTLYLLADSEDGLRFHSREGANPPQLVLTTSEAGDLCPLDPAKNAPGICGCGVSDKDSDQDGIANCREETNLSFPVRGAFYYPWYPETWTVNGDKVFYKPNLGYYDSGDINAIDRHLDMMEYAKVTLAIASWWGRGTQSESVRIKRLLERTVARGSKIKWAFLYEDEGFETPSPSVIASDLDYLRASYASSPAIARFEGKPLVFVYAANDTACEVSTRWSRANRPEWFVSLKLTSGFTDCPNQPDAWHQYGPDTPAQHHKGHSYVISPGFWRADQSAPVLARDSNRFYQNVRDMVASRERWQLITTFNEWGEGTAVEPASAWQSASGYGRYLDALHTDGVQ